MKLEILSSSPTSQALGTIILVHGAWHSAVCWADTFLPYFAECGYNVLAPSLRNHGKSEAGGSLRWRRVKEYAADIQQIVNNTEGKVYLVGHSMGGQVVQKYLELYPNSQVEKAVLLCSVPPHGVWRATLKAIRTHPLSFLLVNLTLSFKPLVSTKEKVKELFFTNRISDKALDKAFTNVQDESYLAYLDMLFLDLPRPKKIKTPMLVIGGGNDFIFGKKDVLATAKAYNTEGVIFEEVAHNLFMEDKWQDSANLIFTFLSS
jgi:pimeloyl-ACP methyl ester carboxylesterase